MFWTWLLILIVIFSLGLVGTFLAMVISNTKSKKVFYIVFVCCCLLAVLPTIHIFLRQVDNKNRNQEISKNEQEITAALAKLNTNLSPEELDAAVKKVWIYPYEISNDSNKVYLILKRPDSYQGIFGKGKIETVGSVQLGANQQPVFMTIIG